MTKHLVRETVSDILIHHARSAIQGTGMFREESAEEAQG